MQSGNQSTALVEFFNYRLASDDGNGDIIVGYQYEYDNGGNITDIKAEVDGALIPLEHYEYEEKQGQLKTAIRYENGEEADRWTYSYDTAGNILSEDHEGSNSELHEYAYEDGRWGDLLTSVDGIDLEYDGSGNPTLYANGTELLWNMEWQNGRQLSRAATERDSTTEDVLDFAYDANGIRTSKTYTVRSTAQIPEYTVTFKADGITVKTMTVEDGYVLKDGDYPAVPAKSGYSGAWRKYTVAIHNDVTINAVYTALETKHTVIFFADGKALKTMQVDNGYTLQASDYPAIPPKEGYTSRWDTRVTRIVKDTAIYAIYSDSSTHTVTFIFAEVECGTLTVADGYILQDSDYPAPLVPSKDVSAVAVWEKYTLPIHEDITVRGNWQGSAVLPTEPSYPDEIMSGGEGEPVEADEPEENGAEPYSAGAMDEADTITHDYLTQSGRVARETIRQSVGGTVLKTETLDFFYDESGRPFAFNYSVDGDIASTYYYILNLQGDVVQIIDANGVMQAEYVYSPWGEIISAEGDLAEVNPLRYRGYYYDSETGFYYLQSRYYDPENHRFINADSYASTGQGFLGVNMFAYCSNNPVNNFDNDGKRQGHASAIAKAKRENAQGKYNEDTINIYMEGNGIDDASKLNVRFYIADAEKGYVNINIDKSLEITDVYDMYAVLSVIVNSEYYSEEMFGSVDYMIGQWIAHNECYNIASASDSGYTIMQRISGATNPIESARSLDLRCKNNVSNRAKVIYKIIPFIYALLN